MTQPHVKLIKLYKLKEPKEIKNFIVMHKNDKLFAQLLMLMVSPEYKFKVEVKERTLRPTVTTPTRETFGKFRTFIYKLELGYNIDIEEYLDTLDLVTAYAYTLVLTRANLGLAPYDILELLGGTTHINNNEYPISFGFPKLPCIVQIVPEGVPRVNVSYAFGLATVTTLDGRRVDHTVELQLELDMLGLDTDSWFTGYIVNDKLYISDYYFNNTVSLSKRLVELEKLLMSNTFDELKLVTTTTVYTVEELRHIALAYTTDGDILLTKQDVPPDFNNTTLNHIFIKPKDII